MIKFTYLKSCLKKNSRLILPSLVFSFVILLLLAIVFGNNFTVDDEKLELPSKAGVGLVGDIDNKMFKTGLSAVKMLDASKDYLELRAFESEEAAAEAIKNEEILGYLIVPKDFIKSVLNGKNTPATFVSKNSLVDLLPMIVNDVVSTVSNLIVESQVGIFAMENFYIENEIANRSKDLNEINLKYISFVISRDDMVKVTELGSEGLLSIKGYYTCVIIILLVLLVGVLCASACIKRDLSLPRLLASRGCGSLSQTYADYLSFIFVPFVSLLVLISALSFFFGDNVTMIPELSELSGAGSFILFFKMLPGMFLLCALQFVIYELCSDFVSGTLLQFIVSIGLAYISGCIYPVGFFPKSLQIAASYMPVGFAFEYIKKVILGIVDVNSVLACLIYGLVFVGLSAFIRKSKIRSRLS